MPTVYILVFNYPNDNFDLLMNILIPTIKVKNIISFLRINKKTDDCMIVVNKKMKQKKRTALNTFSRS